MKHDLSVFREGLERRMLNPSERPFLVDGNPLHASIFIVGYNPATTLNQSFWKFWRDQFGMDQRRFMDEYHALKPMRGVRPRIERIVENCENKKCLETNLYALPTRQAKGLNTKIERMDIFKYIFDSIKPKLMFLHSNKPINFFERETGALLSDKSPAEVSWRGHELLLVVRRGPLWNASYAEAASIGKLLGSLS